jgi:hypothetical protein
VIGEGFYPGVGYATHLDSNEDTVQHLPASSMRIGLTASAVTFEIACTQKSQAGAFDCITRTSHGAVWLVREVVLRAFSNGNHRGPKFKMAPDPRHHGVVVAKSLHANTTRASCW